MVQGLIVRLEEWLLLGGTWEEPGRNQRTQTVSGGLLISKVFLVILLSFIPVQHLCLCQDLLQLQEKMVLRSEVIGTCGRLLVSNVTC